MKISSRKNKSKVWHLEPSSTSLAHFNEENNANRVTTIQLMHHTLYLLRFLSQITFCRIGPLSIFCRSFVVVAFGFEQPKVDKSKLDAIDTADGGHDAHADGHADEDPLAHG